jgi:hypothetical protein
MMKTRTHLESTLGVMSTSVREHVRERKRQLGRAHAAHPPTKYSRFLLQEEVKMKISMKKAEAGRHATRMAWTRVNTHHHNTH